MLQSLVCNIIEQRRIYRCIYIYIYIGRSHTGLYMHTALDPTTHPTTYREQTGYWLSMAWPVAPVVRWLVAFLTNTYYEMPSLVSGLGCCVASTDLSASCLRQSGQSQTFISKLGLHTILAQQRIIIKISVFGRWVKRIKYLLLIT